MVGCCVFILSSCSPSWVASKACKNGSACGAIISICVWVLKSLMVLLPWSMVTIGHLPPLFFFVWSWRSLNVLLCLDVRSLAVHLHPPRRCVMVSGWLHLVHSLGPCELYLFLHRYTCDPHATSYASRLDLHGDCENACMLKYVPVSHAYLRSLLKTPLIGTVLLVCFSSFLMPAFRLVVFLGCVRVCLGECVLFVVMFGGPRLVGPLLQM